MSNAEEMDYQSLPSRSVDTPPSSTSSRRRSTSGRRGQSSISTQAQRLNRSSSRTTSKRKPTRRSSHLSTQSSTIDLSSMDINERNENDLVPQNSTLPPSNLSYRSQTVVRSLPFDVSPDDKQHQRPKIDNRTRSGKINRNEVLSYFTLQLDGRYECNDCHQPYMAYHGSTTNLRRHLFGKHNIVGAAYDSQLAQIKNQSVQLDDSLTTLPKTRQKQLDQAVVDCIIDDSLPFTTFMKPGMVNLIKSFDSRYKPPSRFTIASRVDDAYNKYVDEVKTILKQIPAVAFTADIWKNGRRQYFISLTAHFFNESFETLPLVLSLRQLTERHLAINVQSFISFELDEKFQVPPERRVGITTDCGGEMVAATSCGLFGPRYSCIAHVWNNVVKNGLCLWSPPNPLKFPIDEVDIDDNESVQSVAGDEDDLVDDEDRTLDQSGIGDDAEAQTNNNSNASQLDQIQPTKSTVVMHKKKTIQPNQDEFLSDDDHPVLIQPETGALTLVGLLERVFHLINRSRQLVGDMRNIGVVQTYISTEIGRKGRGMVVDMEVRWNTTFQMLDRLLEHQSLVDNVVRRKFNGLTVIQADRLKLSAFTPDEWDVLRALHHVLMGFDVATTIISASYYPTLADSFWAITKLRQTLISTTDDSRYLELLKKTALNYLEKYIQKHLSNEQQEGMLIAAFLDPEVHNDMSKNDFTKAMAIVKKKIEKISTTTSTNLSLPPPISSTIVSKKETAKQLMNRLAGIGKNQSNARPMSADVEVALFSNTIKTNQSFSQFWSAHRYSFPRIVTLVHRYCLVPATSVSSESAFTIAGFIARKQRSSLSSRALRHLLVLKYRKNLDKFQSTERARPDKDRSYQSSPLNVATSTSV